MVAAYSLGGPRASCLVLAEALVSERLQEYAARAAANLPDLCSLEPKAFAERVINGGVAIDDGDWVQPLYRRTGGDWHLSKLEVLFRVSDAKRVPFPAFPNFVKAATDESPDPDPYLRGAFRSHAVASLRRVDARLSQLKYKQRAAMAKAGLLTTLNFTAKQLDAALSVPLENGKLLALEETEYDDAPAPESLSKLRLRLWQNLGAFSLDDVKPTLSEVEACASGRLAYSPPLTPEGVPFKALRTRYNHDFAFARRFIADFEAARREHPTAKAELKLDEEFCCYLIGVGHAPFARDTMAAWREAQPEASDAARRAGLQLIREALDAGMGIVLEVSFEDGDVQWLYEELPELDGRLFKQGGRSGSAALPYSLLEAQLLSPVLDS